MQNRERRYSTTCLHAAGRAKITQMQMHGPAAVDKRKCHSLNIFQRVAGSYLSTDTVFCIWCLLWPTQKPLIGQHGWPDSVTILTVMSAFSNGCDVVRAGHRKCKQLGLEWNNKHQHRLSFSRAEIVLLNSWMPIQQIIYRMLRVFMKVGRWTSASDDTETELLSNYHVKTLMLWAYELKPKSWWIDETSVVKICVELLHMLTGWLTDEYCPRYFINSSCDLLNLYDASHSTESSSSSMSVTD